jgi:ABC-2 type transport system ATP-binding protein
MNLINVSEIKKSFGKKEVLKGASFNAEKGECIGIVGVNGSGKSTLLSILTGIVKADSGSGIIDGIDVLKYSKEISKIVGYVPQENPLIADLTVKDNLKLWYTGSKYSLKDELESGFLKNLGIDEFVNMTVKKLSGGMKKRVSIGIAVSKRPPVLILDEPSAALDLMAKKIIRDYLLLYIKEGGTVVIATHDEDELSICDRLYVVIDGKLEEVDKKLRGDDLLYKITNNKGEDKK